MEIYKIGYESQEEVLRSVAQPVTEFDQELKTLIKDMLKEMEDSNGIGLAAPQIGISKRILVVGSEEIKPMAFINPEIIETSLEENIYEEGCLSVPKMYAKVTRPRRVKVQAWNERGRPFTVEADDLLATVLQHEIDHLNGILFIDHLKDRPKEKLLKKYNKIMGL
ncbi:MAG: peptide deformylase [Spirochaetaceae bacterium 4572_7]|nr:MAG: peptide deformylase [Spirochaetaceae bacterium 4572_7]